MMAGFFLLTYPIIWLLLAHPWMYPAAHGYRKVWGWFLIIVCFIRPQVKFERKLKKGKQYVFVPNHSSYLDIVSCSCLLPGTLSFMAKKELANIPLFGRFFRTIDVAVDRKKNTAAHKAFIEAARRLKAGMSILVYPEGTIPSHAPVLGRFKIGAFRMAIEQSAEIVPVTLPDNHRRLPDGKFLAFPGRMRMIVHRPLPTAHLNPEQAAMLKDEVFHIIENQLKKSGALKHEDY